MGRRIRWLGLIMVVLLALVIAQLVNIQLVKAPSLQASVNNPGNAAKVYNKLTGVPVEKFMAVSQSFAVEVKMKADDAYVLHGQVDSTPFSVTFADRSGS